MILPSADRQGELESGFRINPSRVDGLARLRAIEGAGDRWLVRRNATCLPVADVKVIAEIRRLV